MNVRIIISAIVSASLLLASTGVLAQDVATRKEYRKIERHERFLNRQVKDKAIRSARKEARKLAKQGYKAPVGKLPIDKQLEKAWQCQYEMDSNGYPFYFIATARTTGSNYSAAQMQAVNLAKLDLAGQIQRRFFGAVTDQDHGYAEQNGIGEDFPFFVGEPDGPTQQGEQCQYIEGDTAIDGQTEAVDKHSVEESAEADCSGDDDIHHGE